MKPEEPHNNLIKMNSNYNEEKELTEYYNMLVVEEENLLLKIENQKKQEHQLEEEIKNLAKALNNL